MQFSQSHGVLGRLALNSLHSQKDSVRFIQVLLETVSKRSPLTCYGTEFSLKADSIALWKIQAADKIRHLDSFQ